MTTPASPLPSTAASTIAPRAPRKKKFVYWTSDETRRCLEGTAMAGGNFLRISKVVESRSSYMCRKHLRSMAERAVGGAAHINTADGCVSVVLARLGVEPPPPSQLPACRDPNATVFVQAVPRTSSDETIIAALGKNPCVQIRTRGGRCIWDLVAHLYHKWNKPLVLVRPDGSMLSPDDHTGAILDALQTDEDEEGVVQVEYTLLDLVIDDDLLGKPGGGGNAAADGPVKVQSQRAAAAQPKTKAKTPAPVSHQPTLQHPPPPPLVNPRHLLTKKHRRPVVLQQLPPQPQQTPLYYNTAPISMPTATYAPSLPLTLPMMMDPPQPIFTSARVAQRTKKLSPKPAAPAPARTPVAAPAANPAPIPSAMPDAIAPPPPQLPLHMVIGNPPTLPPRRKQPKRTYAGPPPSLLDAEEEGNEMEVGGAEKAIPMAMLISNSASGVASSSKKRPPLKPAKRLVKRQRTSGDMSISNGPNFLSKWAAKYDSLDGHEDNGVPMESVRPMGDGNANKAKHVVNTGAIDSVALEARQLDMETVGEHLVAPISSNSMFGGSGRRTLSLRLDLSARFSPQIDQVEAGAEDKGDMLPLPSPVVPAAKGDSDVDIDITGAATAPADPHAEISRGESNFRTPPILTDSVALAISQTPSADAVQQYMQLTGSMFGTAGNSQGNINIVNVNINTRSLPLPPLDLSRDSLPPINGLSAMFRTDNALDVTEDGHGNDNDNSVSQYLNNGNGNSHESATPQLPGETTLENEATLSFSKIFAKASKQDN